MDGQKAIGGDIAKSPSFAFGDLYWFPYFMDILVAHSVTFIGGYAFHSPYAFFDCICFGHSFILYSNQRGDMVVYPFA